ncbi:MAG: phosphate ABC transporter permease PstA [Anaerolineales bacterium]|nr:phosphate ABC transporter permease PstA [Anaerolineales bacterium]
MLDGRYVSEQVEQELYPDGIEAEQQIQGRQRTGCLWGWSIFAALLVAIVLLLVLLVTIINQSFGYIVEQSEVPEALLVTNFNKGRVVNAPNVVLSNEDDQALADAIASDPNGSGFFGYAFYNANQDGLKLLSIDGVTPTAETVNSGEYSEVRPLYIYSAESIVADKPEVSAFLIYYLTHLDEVVSQVGYFPADAEALALQLEEILAGRGIEALPTINPADYSGEINIVGSSTVFPITELIADKFIADGFQGEINLESTGTGGGFTAFCIDNDNIDIVDASRPIETTEFEACRANGRNPLEFRVGTDAVVVVVNSANDFVTDINDQQLEQLFTEAVTWSDIDASWPQTEIARYIPTADSGTMDFFVQTTFLQQALGDLSYDGLVGAYTANVTLGRCRAVERTQKFYADRLVCDNQEAYDNACASDNPPDGCTAAPHNAASLQTLIQEDVVKPKILKSWFLFDSLLNKNEIFATAAVDYPNAEVKFKSWLSGSFAISPQSSQPEIAGIRTAILGSIWVVGIAILFAFPFGVAAAIYLQEYADSEKWYNRIIQTNINNLAGVPSIIYGMLGLAVFVRALEPLTSGAAFGFVDAGATANGRTIISAGLTLGLLGLPIIIIAAQEAIKAVPNSLREGSMGLGATKWQTIWHHVLPASISGILTGTILTMSRMIGETAPLVVVGASTFITTDPSSPFSKFTTLPAQIYQWTTRPQDTFRNIAGAAIIALLVLLLILNALAIFLRNRYSKQLS